MPAAIEADRTYRTLGILWLLYAILRFAGAVFILIYRATLTLM
jgi:hypothetical protein